MSIYSQPSILHQVLVNTHLTASLSCCLIFHLFINKILCNTLKYPSLLLVFNYKLKHKMFCNLGHVTVTVGGGIGIVIWTVDEGK